MLKRVGPPSLPPSLTTFLHVFLYYHTLGITLPTATAVAAMTAVAPLGRNGIAFGGPVLQIRFTRSITHGKKGRQGRGSLARSVVTAEVGSRVSMKGMRC